ncbi:MAG: L,D-transpeptidase [Oscillospiraceae bacterium]|jgi:hypothetical protein|nr:L,D-transpeptidase [Oscillospiraceae bacterium]
MTFQKNGLILPLVIKDDPTAKVTVNSGDQTVAAVSSSSWNSQKNAFVYDVKSVSAGTTMLSISDGTTTTQIPVTVAKQVQITLDTPSPYTFQQVGKSYTVLIHTDYDQAPAVSSSDTSVMTAAAPQYDKTSGGYLCTMKAVGSGSATLSVTAGSTTKYLQVSVPQITIWADTSSYTFNKTGQQYTVLIRTVPNAVPTVSSSNSSVVTAGPVQWKTGLAGYLCTLTGQGGGTADVTIAAGKSVQIIKVKFAATVSCDTGSYTFQTSGQEYTMLVKTSTGEKPQLSTSNAEIASIGAVRKNGSNGYLCVLRAGQRAGTADISIWAGGTTVHVPVSLTLSQTNLWVDTASYSFYKVGQQYTALIRTNPKIQPIVTSTNPSVVTADTPVWNAKSGGYLCKMTAVGSGSADLIVRAGSQERRVAVKFEPKLTCDTSSYTFYTFGQEYTMLVTTTANTSPNITLKDPNIVTVSSETLDGTGRYLIKLQAGNTAGSTQVVISSGTAQKIVSVTLDPAKVVMWADTSTYTFRQNGQQYTALIRTTPNVRPVATSSNTAVATADTPVWSAKSNGYLCKLTGKGDGDATITLQAGNAVQTIRVQFITTISCDTGSYTFLTRGQEYTMKVDASTGAKPSVTSGNTSVVQVVSLTKDGSGYLCKLRAGDTSGKASVSITSGKGKVSVPITVALKPVAISLDTSSYTFYYKGQQYTALAVIANSTPAVISADGSASSVQISKQNGNRYFMKLTAQQNGTTTLRVRAGSSEKTAVIKVSLENISITANASSHSFTNVQQSYEFVFYTSHNFAPQFKTSNSRVASVQNLGWSASQKGYRCKVTSISSGSATITAYIGSAAQRSVSVKVSTPISSLDNSMLQRAQQYTSPTSYLFLVDTSNHHVCAYSGSRYNWKLIRSFACTNGAPATPTIKGTFHTQSRGYYFDSGVARCFYYTQIYGGYMFHSVLYSQTPTPTTIIDGRLGQALSHGCVRLALDNAKWINKSIPLGTTVVIY